MREIERMTGPRSFSRLGLVALLLCALLGCASFNPVPMGEVPFQERTQSQSRDGITVTTTVLSREESKQIFGVDLAKKRIQPVWFEIENETELPFSILLTSVDPGYFSAHEAAYRNHLRFRPGTNKKIDEHFSAHALDPSLPPRSRTSGFLFTNLKLGTKEVRLRVFGPGRTKTFEFYVPVPGFRADYHEVDWDTLLAQDFVEYEDEGALRQALQELPCCTTRKNGSGAGDPVNLILIGDIEPVANALIRAGWDETETLTFGSALRTFRAFFGGEYKYSPMSALYLYGRAQDAGFQKARDTIHERNHLRLWFSPPTRSRSSATASWAASALPRARSRTATSCSPRGGRTGCGSCSRSPNVRWRTRRSTSSRGAGNGRPATLRGWNRSSSSTSSPGQEVVPMASSGLSA
jgi:hypothetical protein